MVAGPVHILSSFRHRGDGDKIGAEEDTGPFPKSADGKLPWPILHGGTFLSIVQRRRLSQTGWCSSLFGETPIIPP